MLNLTALPELVGKECFFLGWRLVQELSRGGFWATRGVCSPR